jgi:hypothetical protein
VLNTGVNIARRLGVKVQRRLTLLNVGTYNEDELKLLMGAFEEALRQADVQDRTSEEAAAIARRLLLAFKQGESHQQRLARQAARVSEAPPLASDAMPSIPKPSKF